MKKWQIVDLLRTFSIVAVLAAHSYLNLPMSNPWLAWIWGTFCNNSIYGVFLFFATSGFLITHVIARNPSGLFKPNARTFYVQRIGRIWPLYYLCLGFGVMVFCLFPGKSVFFAHLFPVPGVYSLGFWFSVVTFTFNWFWVSNIALGFGLQWSVLWTLSVEEQFYFLYPLALKKIETPKKLLTVLSMVVAVSIVLRIGFYFFHLYNIFFQMASPAVFDLMAIGILLYLAVQQYGAVLSKNKWVSLGLCLVGFALILFVFWGTSMNNPIEEIYVPEILGLGFFAFLLGGLHLDFFESKFLKILSFPGKYCYGCYLLHPTLLFFIQWFLVKMNVFLALLFFTAITTAAAAISYHFFEMPINRLIRRTFDPTGAAR